MKKIKLILLMSMFIIITSCDDANNSGNLFDGIVDNKQDVNITLQPTDFVFLGDSDAFDFNVTLPNTFSVNSVVTVEFQSQNDPGRISSSTVEVESNSSNGTGNISTPDEDDLTTGNFEGGFGTFKVSAFSADDGKGVLYVGKSEPINVTIYDNVPSLDEDNLSILMDWVSPTTTDIDVKLLDPFNFEIASGASGDRYETLSLPNTIGDGEYTVEVTVFATDLTDIPYKFFVIDSNANKTLLEGTFTNVTVGDVLSQVITITKTGDTYVIN